MVSKLLTVAVLATSVLAHPNHKRHTRFHHGTGNGFAMPTGATFPMTNGTSHNGTDFGGSPIESPSSVEATSVLPTATAVMTLTVSPVPLDTAKPDTGLSSVPNAIAIPSNTDVAAASSSPAGAQGGSPPGAPAGAGGDSCSVLTSTVTSTSVQYVTVTATAGSDVAPTGAPGGFYGASSSEAAASSAPATSSTFMPSGDAGEFFPAPSSSATGSLSINSPTAGEFFPHPGQQTSYPAGGASSMTFPSIGSGVTSLIPTTFATVPSVVPSMSSSTPSSSSVPSTGGSTSGKKGLSYNTASLTNAFAGKGISWAYNWGAQPDGTIVSGAEFVPMFWGAQSVNGWASAAASAIASGSKHVLSLNEPDLAGQADVDPTTAAQLHIDNMNPFAGQVQIGSVAVTNGAGTSPLMGIDYLNAWFEACNGQCKVDFVAFHWYDSANNLAYFKSHVNDVITAAKANGVSKVWLTEFGATGSDSDVSNFVTEAVAFLESTDAVERYAYFMCSDGILVNGNSISSPVGSAYAG